MASVFLPNQQQLTALGYHSIAAVPVLFDSAHRYLREYNWYLRERALLEWTPDGKSASEKRAMGRRVRYPAEKTLKTYAYALKNWIEWKEVRGVDWRTAEYEKHLLRYRDDMLSGRWSAVLRRAFDFDVTRCISWDDYAHKLLDHRVTLGGNEAFVQRANHWAGLFSSGERLLLAACLQGADYAWLGDELLDNKFLQKVWVVARDPCALAVAAPILRID